MTKNIYDKFNGGGGNTSQEFHIGDIISVYHGILASPKGMDGVYKTLNFLTGDSLMTHDLPPAAEYCKPFIEQQFPEITKINAESLSAQVEIAKNKGNDGDKAFKTWLNNQVQAYGEKIPLIPLTKDEMKDFGQYMIDNSLLLKRFKTDNDETLAIDHNDGGVS